MQLAVNEDLIVMAIWGLIFFIFIIKLFQSIRLVPTKSAYIVERLGKYHSTLDAGFHALIPFVDKVAYIHDLKEETIDVPPQECFSSDEVKVEVDGVIYISVVDPVKASYGVTDYRYAAIQLAQTTTRSVIGTLELDRTFEERDVISAKVVEVLDQAGALWGIRVHRYEIKNIQPPETVKNAMEMQVNAERERRALLAKSEGDKQAKINRSEGIKAETINRSEGEMQKRINEAEGKAEEILAIARATAESIERLAAVIAAPGGQNALRLQLGEQYLSQLKGLGQQGSRVVVPANMVNFDQWMDAMGLKEQG
ncbi:SPFH domain-containing protein [Shewanella litorisediminis]|uniref:Paraslipin n=1 Tax=Shewanella litorisediminis TaxID=1173586 RepID=A0ABX7G4H2_9GAMM|nr:stomatin-like protein [Shewanella litorisediminis]MCL2917777.1 paraslipin [Shewanella litorisediminis]QRH02220.1 paraslipin [Shewanella litorisediminis]